MPKNSEKSEKSEAADPKQRKRAPFKRKPLWLCLPLETESFVSEETAEISVRVKSYEIIECHSKKDVGRVLASKKIDAADLNSGSIKLLRAHPLEFKVTSQVSIKF